MSDTQMRQIEREMSMGDYSRLMVYHNRLVGRYAIEPENPLRISPNWPLPVNHCHGWGWVHECECFHWDCVICEDSANSIDCSGCLACVAPGIFFGFQERIYMNAPHCRYASIHPKCPVAYEYGPNWCESCVAREAQLRRIERLKSVKRQMAR